jgi:sulfur dioxygenase
MIFRPMFEPKSSTYTYLVAEREGGEAFLIDPVVSDVPKYLQLIRDLDLKLVYGLDTHVHADHITGLGDLRDEAGCVTVLGEQTEAACVSYRVKDGEVLKIGDLTLKALHTPGHTPDSYSFVMADRVFTGDTLLIRGTGRTDFQRGDAGQQYDAIFGKLMTLPASTLVYPGHDYKGWTVSTIGEERRFNPRLQVKNKAEYVELMANLKLPNPAQMDIAVPANLQCGRTTPRQPAPTHAA